MISANDGQAILSPDEHADRLSEQLRLAVEVADEACQSDIEQWGQELGERWYDIAPHGGDDEYEREVLARAEKYLTLRGRLQVDPVDPQKVRVQT